jgi:hypothetical protein
VLFVRFFSCAAHGDTTPPAEELPDLAFVPPAWNHLPVVNSAGTRTGAGICFTAQEGGSFLPMRRGRGSLLPRVKLDVPAQASLRCKSELEDPDGPEPASRRRCCAGAGRRGDGRVRDIPIMEFVLN